MLRCKSQTVPITSSIFSYFGLFLHFQGKLMRLKPLRLVVSHTFLNRKLDAFGKDHDAFLKSAVFTPSLKRKIVIDNFDFRTQVHDMTEDNQNVDNHWVSVASTENRIVCNLLSDQPKPTERLMQIENGVFLPSGKEYDLQRQNYIVICGRIACKYINDLKIFEEVTIPHIKHAYSMETSKPTDTVSINSTTMFDTETDSC